MSPKKKGSLKALPAPENSNIDGFSNFLNFDKESLEKEKGKMRREKEIWQSKCKRLRLENLDLKRENVQLVKSKKKLESMRPTGRPRGLEESVQPTGKRIYKKRLGFKKKNSIKTRSQASMMTRKTSLFKKTFLKLTSMKRLK